MRFLLLIRYKIGPFEYQVFTYDLFGVLLWNERLNAKFDWQFLVCGKQYNKQKNHLRLRLIPTFTIKLDNIADCYGIVQFDLWKQL